jgi:hypothetical protein
MPQPTLEERVAALEKEVARLAGKLRSDDEPGPHDWKLTLGMFANDPIMREIEEEGRKIREADRRRARRSQRRRDK